MENDILLNKNAFLFNKILSYLTFDKYGGQKI